MAMKRCPVCGEKYSETYKNCPFCEEEAALNQGEQIRRSGGRGGKRTARHQQPNLLSPILIVLIVLMACLLVYLLFGDRIAETIRGGRETDTPPVSDVTPEEPDISGDGDAENPEDGVVMPSDGDMDEPEDTDNPDTQTADLSALPDTLTMNYLGSPRKEFTMAVGDDPIPLTASGGSGSYTWSSSDDGVVSVGADGTVTAVSVGRAVLTVHDGAGKGTCTVLVKAGANGQTAVAGAGTAASGSGGVNKLSSTDFTLYVGQPDVKLTVSGITTAITWTSKNPAVATVSGSGVVKAVGVGTTTVTASWDGRTLECIVRVPG